MAVIRKKNEEMQDLVVLEKSEALHHQMEILQAWEPQWQIWPVKHSPGILAGVCALSCIFINSHYRSKFRLFNYGRMASYLPTVVIPAMASAVGHSYLVQTDVLLRETKCSLCIELRAAAMQTAASVFYPMTLAPLSAFALASRYRTFIVPNLLSHHGRLLAFQTWSKFTKPISDKLLGMVLLQGLAAAVMAYMEMKTVAMVDLKFAEILAEEGNEDSMTV